MRALVKQKVIQIKMKSKEESDVQSMKQKEEALFVTVVSPI